MSYGLSMEMYCSRGPSSAVATARPPRMGMNLMFLFLPARAASGWWASNPDLVASPGPLARPAPTPWRPQDHQLSFSFCLAEADAAARNKPPPAPLGLPFFAIASVGPLGAGLLWAAGVALRAPSGRGLILGEVICERVAAAIYMGPRWRPAPRRSANL